MTRALLLGAALIPFVLSTQVRAAFQPWNPLDTSTTPKTVSATGFYANMLTREVTPEAVYFEPNAQLWSDDAKKKRWIIVPTGQKVIYDDSTDFYAYPEGTFFVKNFYHDLVPGDSTTRILWETRFLANKLDEDTVENWYGFSYKWRKDQSDADLVDLDYGLRDTLRIYPNGMTQPGVLRKWHFPSQGMCGECHVSWTYEETKTRSVLGFFTAQLNQPAPKQPGINQLIYLFNQGVFDRQPDPALAPRWYAIDDESAPLDNRARSYIAANCSGCHGNRGIPPGLTMGLEANYDYYRGVPEIELRAYELGQSFGVDGEGLIVPGQPEKSAILFRQKARNDSVDISSPQNFNYSFGSDPNQMPPLATYIEDTVATKYLAQWIEEMEVLSIESRRAPLVFQKPLFKNRQLYLPAELAVRPGVEVKVLDAAGRSVSIDKVGQGVYRLSESLPRGLYLFKVEDMSFTHYLF